MAKISPNASTLNPKLIPSNMVGNIVKLIVSPLTTIGAMERTSANTAMLATIVHISLIFG
jgi:hypothetical protein